MATLPSAAVSIARPHIAHDYRVARCSAPTALAIGNFDGVHRGHQHLMQRVVDSARRLGGQAVALTFEPHPTRVLAPERAAPLLMGLDRKLELLSTLGLDAVVVQRFDLSLSSQSPAEFVDAVVMGLRAREVYIGADFHFGRNREGNGAVLAELGVARGFTAHVVPPVQEAGATISSSRIRKALADGDIDLAASLLGRPYDLDGLVVAGQRRGRTLGFPTANLATPCEALPRDGVYAVRVQRRDQDDGPWAPAVMNLGQRPTVQAGRSIEAHLLDADVDLYGQTLRVRFVKRLRDERRFDSLDALRAQIATDSEAARAALAETLKP